MERGRLIELLADSEISFLQKLKYAAELELDLWSSRTPPNLGANEFVKVLGYIPSNIKVIWAVRKSTKGSHGLTGDDEVFKFKLVIRILGQDLKYFIKGYFFDKGQCRGVCIQSFRELKKKEN